MDVISVIHPSHAYPSHAFTLRISAQERHPSHAYPVCRISAQERRALMTNLKRISHLHKENLQLKLKQVRPTPCPA